MRFEKKQEENQFKSKLINGNLTGLIIYQEWKTLGFQKQLYLTNQEEYEDHED